MACFQPPDPPNPNGGKSLSCYHCNLPGVVHLSYRRCARVDRGEICNCMFQNIVHKPVAGERPCTALEYNVYMCQTCFNRTTTKAHDGCAEMQNTCNNFYETRPQKPTTSVATGNGNPFWRHVFQPHITVADRAPNFLYDVNSYFPRVNPVNNFTGGSLMDSGNSPPLRNPVSVDLTPPSQPEPPALRVPYRNSHPINGFGSRFWRQPAPNDGYEDEDETDEADEDVGDDPEAGDGHDADIEAEEDDSELEEVF